MDQSNYSVEFTEYSERHYIKPFKKKYKSKWDGTREIILVICQRIDNILEFDRADLIAQVDEYKLVKLDFAVEGVNKSAKNSGNRCILHINEAERKVQILIVYSKNDIAPPNETQKWKNDVKTNFKGIADIYSL
jgi:hypothetical protein